MITEVKRRVDSQQIDAQRLSARTNVSYSGGDLNNGTIERPFGLFVLKLVMTIGLKCQLKCQCLFTGIVIINFRINDHYLN